MISAGSELICAADVAQGRFGIRVAEELLDDEEGRLVYGHVGAHGMADGVG